MNILVTGASGFIGSFIVAEALSRGMQTWAGVRATSSRRWIDLPGVHFFPFDCGRTDELRHALEEFRAANGRFDYVVHCAGVTKCRDRSEFDRVNHQQTAAFVDLLRDLQMVPRQFIFISTLSVYGPQHETDFAPITEADTPRPNTAYGQSKRQAELHMERMTDFPYVFLRPTGVYGPRERDYLMAMQSIARHVDFAAGRRRQDLTFIYVDDIVQAVFRVIESGVSRRAYALSDGRVYSSAEFSRLVRRELGNPWVIRFACPLWLLRLISGVAESLCRHRTLPLNRDKYRIMAQRNWRCDTEPARREIGYSPEVDLAEGIRRTVAWYKQEGWI